ncbi:MAG: C10 family peptidase [Bacteroidaceae bacterium]|nr:C10 family peptidase [Bacteroidaceae bacterium]
MKKLFSILAVASLWSCSNDVVIIEDTPQFTAENNVSAVSQKQNAVTFSDIKKYAKPYQAVTRSADDAELSYDFIIDETNDTLLYIVNYADGGWTIYSSDKRLPAVVAESQEGVFDKDEDSPMAIWVHTMAEDIKLAKQATDEELSFSAEDIQSNRDNWDAVCDVDNFVRNHQAVTRKIPPIDGFEPAPRGHYELARTERYTEAYDSIGHLTNTRWHQDRPYNEFGPRIDTVLFKAGCVAVAGAQMLYYLHYKLGVPQNAPSTVAGETSSTIWELMLQNGYYAAPLIADVGTSINTVYGVGSSGADLENLIDDVFAKYGIACSFDNFVTDSVQNNLLNEMPVIVGAYATQHHIFGFTRNSDGHAFILDAYKRTKHVTKYTYQWIPEESDDAPAVLVPVDDRIEYLITAPSLTYIKMNWGWKNQSSHPDREQWFAVTGDWIVAVDGENQNFKYNRKIICNFHILE